MQLLKRVSILRALKCSFSKKFPKGFFLESDHFGPGLEKFHFSTGQKELDYLEFDTFS
jgi:hypothetical protein